MLHNNRINLKINKLGPFLNILTTLFLFQLQETWSNPSLDTEVQRKLCATDRDLSAWVENDCEAGEIALISGYKTITTKEIFIVPFTYKC